MAYRVRDVENQNQLLRRQLSISQSRLLQAKQTLSSTAKAIDANEGGGGEALGGDDDDDPDDVPNNGAEVEVSAVVRRCKVCGWPIGE